MVDHRSYTDNLSSCEFKPSQKFWPEIFQALIFFLSSMINHKFISFCAVQIYDLLYIQLH